MIVGLLVGYALLQVAGGSLAPFENIVSRVDTALFGALLYQFDPVTGLGHDPEGLLGTLPAIATTLLGVRAGAWLRRGDMRTLLLPLNKNLWTSSYVLWAGGWSLLVLAVLHVAIDRRGRFCALDRAGMGRGCGVAAVRDGVRRGGLAV